MKLYRLIHKHQNEARSVKIAGQWRDIDPRAWEADVRCTVSVGLGTGAKEKQLMMLQMIQGDQVAWVQAYGPATPVVTPQHLHNLVAEKLRVMGFKTPDKFFGDPVDPQTGQPFVPQPPPDPKTQAVQAKIQEGQAKLQLDAQAAQMSAQVKQFETQAKVKSDAEKAQLDAAVAEMEMQGRLRIMEQEAMAKMAVARFEAEQNAQLARDQFEFEKELKRQELAAKIEAMRTQANAKAEVAGSSTQFGGEPG
jgi:hypothetical protein